MTYKNFEKKDSFWKILIKETDFLQLVAIMGTICIISIITFLLHNSKLFLSLWDYFNNNKSMPYVFVSVLTYACVFITVSVIFIVVAVFFINFLIPLFMRIYAKLSYVCMLNRICYLPFTVEEIEKYHASGLEQLLLLVLKTESYKKYDGYKLHSVLPKARLIAEKNEQLFENIKIVFKEDFDNNGFMKKDIRDKVCVLISKKTNIYGDSVILFLDRLNAGKDF